MFYLWAKIAWLIEENDDFFFVIIHTAYWLFNLIWGAEENFFIVSLFWASKNGIMQFR